MNIFPSPSQRLNPFDFYAKMRNKNPIAYDEENDLYGIFRYNDISKCFTDFKNFSSDFSRWFNSTNANSSKKYQDASPIGPSLITSDPPKHRNLRNSISEAFNPRQISVLEHKIEKITHDLLENVIQNKSMDLIQDLAYPLPVMIIAELLGIPNEDHCKFKKWADQIISLSINTIRNPNEEVYENNYKLKQEMNSYFSSIIDTKKEDPKNDLISRLIKSSVLNVNDNDVQNNTNKEGELTQIQQIQKKKDSFVLSQEDILSFCNLLLLAGHVTTVNLIGNIFLSLFENPKQFKLLQNRPLDYIKPTIEETLRYRSPVQFLSRVVANDIEIGNGTEKVRLNKGKRVFLCIGSANRDETIFTNAEQFDIARNPNNHIGFGAGIHLCIGAPLARLEAQVVLKVLLKMLKDIELDTTKADSVVPVNSMIIYGVEHLPFNFKLYNN
ncbi:MAG TPA: cytochrome P450 [Candidatus Sulfopaludibacter sp.]|jgi:cytochrome P450|nr:cytochrome P450 [Candidatus Sulfopaludibacter sp.]